MRNNGALGNTSENWLAFLSAATDHNNNGSRGVLEVLEGSGSSGAYPECH